MSEDIHDLPEALRNKESKVKFTATTLEMIEDSERSMTEMLEALLESKEKESKLEH